MKAKIRFNIIINLFSAVFIAVACDAVAEDRVVDGNISSFAAPVDLNNTNIKILNVGHYRQTTPYTCGPAAVMNLMYYYKMLAPKDMNKDTEMRISMEMHASDAGTTPSQLEGWLSDHGFTVYSGQRVSSDMLINNLKE